MKTPYDSALRIRQREIDDLSARIGAEAGLLADLDAALRELDATVDRERAFSAGDLSFSADRYRERMREVRATLEAERAAAGNRLEELRGLAINAISMRRAMETAAELFIDEEIRAEENAIQAGLDDVTTAAVVQRRGSLLQQQRS